MKTLLSVVLWVAELGLALALIGSVMIALAFSSEGHRGRILPLHQALNTLGLILAILPLGLVLWTGYRHFLSSRPNTLPLGLGFPLAAGVGCALASLLALILGDQFSQVGAEAAARRAKVKIRELAEAGNQELFCSVMVTDPEATARDMQQCRAHIESQPMGSKRWFALDPFIQGRGGMKTWNLQEVGLSPFPDKEVSLAIVHHEQAWFLRTFFETLLGYQNRLYWNEVSILRDALRQLTPAAGWSREAIEQLRPEVLPELLKRITPRPGVDLDGSPDDLKESRELIAQLLASGPQEVPPMPALASPPTAETIGVVRMADDEALEFWMRATATQGNLGDVYFRHAPGSESYKQWMSTLGPMFLKGQVRLLPRPKAP